MFSHSTRNHTKPTMQPGLKNHDYKLLSLKFSSEHSLEEVCDGYIYTPLPVPTFPYGLNKPPTKTLINNVIIESNDAHNMSLSSYYLQGLYRCLDPNYKTFFRLFSKTIIHFQTHGYQKGDQWRP